MNEKQDIRLAVDSVVFGYYNQKLEVLLIQPKYGDFQHLWALPGGFIKNTETLTEAVVRELKEETGVKLSYLEQLATFGAVNRDPRFRVVTVAYLGLSNPKNHVLKADTDAKDVNWFCIDNLPELAYDHAEIIQTAIERLKRKVKYEPIGFDLLNKKFSFSELEQLYQTILSRKLDRRNFRKKILALDLLDETGEMSKPKNGRPAMLYSFNKKKYEAYSQDGFHVDFKFV